MAEHPSSSDAGGDSANDAPTRILLAVSQSSIQGYPHPSISSRSAFHWLVDKLIPPASRPKYKLLILHVQVPDEDAFDDMDSLYATKDDFKAMKHEDKVRGVHLLEHFVHSCNDIELPCKAWIKKGDARETICKEVSRVHPDMLVMGSRGLKTIHKLFVGTVSEYCTKHADCPVLVIRRKAEDAPDDPMED
ncbi:hypothetical protein L7F22_016096 [Adiantum nelumboides]|nr:hypothetical protein [Adiantum nelumboides]